MGRITDIDITINYYQLLPHITIFCQLKKGSLGHISRDSTSGCQQQESDVALD